MQDALITKRDTPHWQDLLKQARVTIHDRLKDCPNFQEVYFTDGYNGAILMAGENKEFPGRPFGGYFVINSRLSNLNHEVDRFTDEWLKCDTEAYRSFYHDMLEREKENA